LWLSFSYRAPKKLTACRSDNPPDQFIRLKSMEDEYLETAPANDRHPDLDI
jgi:hypothetical protein